MDPVAIATTPNLFYQVGKIPKLVGTDFQMWKVSVAIVVRCMELDLALRTERPRSTPEDPNEAEIKKWDRSNQMCLMVMKRSLPKAFRGLVDEKDNARKFLDEIEPCFAKNNNPDATKLFADLVSMKYEGVGSVEKYILDMFRLASKLKSLELELPENLLVDLVLTSLPAQFEQLKTCYNTQIYRWSMDELLSRCKLEEETQSLFGKIGSSPKLHKENTEDVTEESSNGKIQQDKIVGSSLKSQERQMQIGKAHGTTSPELHKKKATELQERNMQRFDRTGRADSTTIPKSHKENTKDVKKEYYEQKKKDNNGHAKRNCPLKKDRYGAVSW